MPEINDSLDEEERYEMGVNDRTEGWGHDAIINVDGPATPGASVIIVPEDLRD